MMMESNVDWKSFLRAGMIWFFSFFLDFKDQLMMIGLETIKLTNGWLSQNHPNKGFGFMCSGKPKYKQG